ncbi:MAG: hypothetical protein RRY07_10595 [Bacteroidaceae bacterium]
METNTIIEIRKLRDSITLNLEGYRKRLKEQKADMNVGQYGNESEYSLNGLIGGVKNILTDVSYLVKSHDLFIKISTYNERSEMQSALSNLNSYIVNSSHSSIATYLDDIKVRLRKYNLRSDRDRYLEFSNEVDNLRKKALLLEENITEVKTAVADSLSTYKTIKETKESYDEALTELDNDKKALIENVSKFDAEFQQLKSLVSTAVSNETIISKKLESVVESEESFNAFIDKIKTRESQLIEQKKQTDKYNSELQVYSEEHFSKLKEVKQLIDKALIALQYTTAGGMSKAFQDQYDKANGKWTTWTWLLGASGFVAITLGLGIWIVLGWGIDKTAEINIPAMIGRLSMIPFTLLGALFCARQYVKQKNIIEDYAYKTVLSKSIVAFSEELRMKDEKGYTEYISTVLKEIHQDPLRKRDKEKDDVSLKDSTGMIQKIIELIGTVHK